MAHWIRAYVHLLRGDISQANPLLERALPLTRGIVQYHLPMVGSMLAYSYAFSGRERDALALLKEVIPLRSTTRDIPALCSQGAAYWLLNRREAATESAEYTVEVAVRLGARGAEAESQRLLAEIAAHAEPPEIAQAESYYRQALTLAEELVMRPLVAHCHLGLGSLYQRIGQREQAQTELTAATEMYRQMEMTFWLDKAGTALAKVAS
jgi:tetratricopeptide (TPR) repeat protein